MTLTQLPKPLLFGLFGVVGCALGWAAGEPLQRAINTPRTIGGTGAAVVSPTFIGDNPPFDNEALRRAEESGRIQKGPIKIGLSWSNTNDLDLHCIDPTGAEIWYHDKTSPTGGVLDLDCNAALPYVTDAAEHIVWPQTDFPSGTYKVFVRHYANHGGSDPTAFSVEIFANGERVPSLGGSLNPDQNSAVRTFSVINPAERGRALPDASRSAAGPGLDLRAVGLVALWTALLAVPLGLALVLGQNAIQRRRLFAGRQLAVTGLGCLAAGLCAGGVSQCGFAVMAGTLRLQNVLLLSAEQVVGWLALGALLGLIMAFVIPNLPPGYALLGGMAGGVVGALAFLLAKQLPALGATGGRAMGAACLGLGIGVMVALVEKLAREAALIVHWGPKERNILNLGERPIVLGSSREAHLYLPKEQGFPPVAALVTFREGRITLENKMTNTQHTLKNGHKLQLGALILEVQSA